MVFAFCFLVWRKRRHRVRERTSRFFFSAHHPPRKELNKNQNKKLQQQLRLQHAREAHPDRLGPAAARGRAASGERVHSPFGEKKRTKKALPRPLRRKGSPLSHRPSSCSLLQKLQNQKQVFKRIHAAFVEASCNPFYTADSVRGRGKASRDGRDSGGGDKAQRVEERRGIAAAFEISSLITALSKLFTSTPTNRPSTPPSSTPPCARSSAGRELS